MTPWTPEFSVAFGSGTAPLISAVTVVTPNTQRTSIAFTVKGTYTLAGMTYGEGAVSGPTQVSPIVYAYNFVHPAYAAIGTHTLSVSIGGITATSAQFKVVKA